MKTMAQLLAEEKNKRRTTDFTAPNLTISKVLTTLNNSLERELVLREENRQLMSMHKAMMDNDQYGIVITDLEGMVVEINHTAENLLGQKAHQLVGRHVRNIPEISEYMLEVLNAEKRFESIHVSLGNKIDEASLLDTFPMYDEDAKLVGAFAQVHDITEAYRVHERFNHISNHDDYTGLPNRNFLVTKLTDLMVEGKPTQGGNGLAVLHFSLDRFKIVNDTLGFTAGNEILIKIVQHLKLYVKPQEFMARIGGDEFIIIAPYEDESEALQIGHRLHSLFSEPFVLKGYEFHITASIGIVLYPEDGSTPEELLAKADTAMSYAKKNGKNQFVFYTKALDVDAHEKILLEADFRKALDSDELILHYQPKIDIKTGLMSGVEALVRWQHPERGLIPPDQFIPMAEETGLIHQLDEWVLREACAQNKKWQDAGLAPISVAVNLSSAQFTNRKLVELVETILTESELKPEYLELEITETMAMDVEHAIPTLQQLNALGVKISLDDFGTGYSSMNYLTKFAIDRLKIDRSFIWNIEKGGSDVNIVVTIIRMAHGLGLKVIAEGVEDNEQLQFLKEHGCDEVQGYFYSKPLPAEAIQKRFLAKNE